MQRLHRAVRAAAEPDRVAGEPQRDVVGRVQLPRRRAHHHHPRAAQRRRPLPDDRRVLRLRRQRSGAHEPGRGRRTATSCARSAAKRRCTSSTVSAPSPAWPTRRARSRTSTSATTSASSARSRRSRCSTTSTTFLDRNLTDVVVIDIEDYVQPKDLKQALDRRRTVGPGVEAEPEADRLADAATTWWPRRRRPRRRRGTPRRLVVMSEKHPGVYPWLLRHVRRCRRRRRTRSRRPREFNCKPEPGRHRQVVLHRQPLAAPERSARPGRGGQGQLAEGADRARCRTASPSAGSCPTRSRSTSRRQGDLQKTVRRVQRGHRPTSRASPRSSTRRVKQLRAREQLTDAELNALRRLPKISEAEARKLLGPLADSIPTPTAPATSSRHRARPARTPSAARSRRRRRRKKAAKEARSGHVDHRGADHDHRTPPDDTVRPTATTARTTPKPGSSRRPNPTATAAPVVINGCAAD